MDRETLSHYGWIVILVLILACLLAFATPFGLFVADFAIAFPSGGPGTRSLIDLAKQKGIPVRIHHVETV